MDSIRDRLCDELGYEPEPLRSGGPSPATAGLPSCPSSSLPSVEQVGQTLCASEVAAALCDGQRVAVVRTASGRLHVLPDRCPHDGGPLSDGFVDGERLVCARHGWEIDPCSGTCARSLLGAA